MVQNAKLHGGERGGVSALLMLSPPCDLAFLAVRCVSTCTRDLGLACVEVITSLASISTADS